MKSYFLGFVVSACLATACGGSSSGSADDGSGKAAETEGADTVVSCAADADQDNPAALTVTLSHDTEKHTLNVSGAQADTTITFVANAFGDASVNYVSTGLFLGTGKVVDGDGKETQFTSLAIIHPGEDGFTDPSEGSVTLRLGNVTNALDAPTEASSVLVHGHCSSKNNFAAERL